MDLDKVKGMTYHLDCLFELMRESGLDMSVYEKEKSILGAMKEIVAVTEKLDKLINDPADTATEE